MGEEKVVHPSIEDLNQLLAENPTARLQLNVITLTRELTAAYRRIEELEARPCCGQGENRVE